MSGKQHQGEIQTLHIQNDGRPGHPKKTKPPFFLKPRRQDFKMRTWKHPLKKNDKQTFSPFACFFFKGNKATLTNKKVFFPLVFSMVFLPVPPRVASFCNLGCDLPRQTSRQPPKLKRYLFGSPQNYSYKTPNSPQEV